MNTIKKPLKCLRTIGSLALPGWPEPHFIFLCIQR